MACTPEETEPPQMTKLDAVRRALAEGITRPAEGVYWIEVSFGIAVTPLQFSTYKSVLKSRRRRLMGESE